MMAPMDMDTLPGVTRAELRAKKEQEEEQRRQQQEFMDRVKKCCLQTLISCFNYEYLVGS